MLCQKTGRHCIDIRLDYDCFEADIASFQTYLKTYDISINTV